MTQVADGDVWTEQTKNMLKAELKRRGLGYEGLAERLKKQGTHLSVRALTNKISRGGFSAAFLIQCLTAIGCKTLQIESS